jgi:serine/threonine protein kinase
MANRLKGPRIGFAGAIYADKPMLEPLTPMFLFHTNCHDGDASRPLVRALGAMKRAFKSLKEYYTRLSTTLPMDRKFFADPEFPYPNYYTTVDGEVEFQYLQRLDPEKLLFLCSKMKNSTKLFVKFTQRYSKDAHQYCADNGVAPKLYAVKDLPGGWLMVVMEYLEMNSYQALATWRRHERSSFKAGVRKAVEVLHEGCFVHGDIRDANMMVARGWDNENDAQSVKLVDFDWAGRNGDTTYPPNVNYMDISRPMDARDGMPVMRRHDLRMLSDMFP